MLYAMAQDPLEVVARSRSREAEPRVTSATLEARAAGGDRDALAALLRQHGPAIQQLCHYVAGRQEARDSAQEAFERIVVGIGKFDPARGAFRSWALTVARNVCRDRLRRRGLERATFLSDGAAQTDRARAGAADPERVAVARDDVGTLEMALAELPENMRSAIVMFHLHESSYEEIAKALDVPMGTVMTWLHRGRKKLRTALSTEDGGRSA